MAPCPPRRSPGFLQQAQGRPPPPASRSQHAVCGAGTPPCSKPARAPGLQRQRPPAPTGARAAPRPHTPTPPSSSPRSGRCPEDSPAPSLQSVLRSGVARHQEPAFVLLFPPRPGADLARATGPGPRAQGVGRPAVDTASVSLSPVFSVMSEITDFWVISSPLLTLPLDFAFFLVQKPLLSALSLCGSWRGTEAPRPLTWAFPSRCCPSQGTSPRSSSFVPEPRAR